MPLRNDLLDPIPGANPAGADLRYEPVYDQIKLARHEEVDAPQGDWQRARKVADYALVVKLAGEVLAKQSKDLQIAAWLTEALIHREGFAGLGAGLELLRALIDQFWEHLYPELEDGDAEFRATPLEWVGYYLDATIRSVPLNQAGHGFLAYKESRIVGLEADAEYDSAKQAARQEAIAEGKLTAEDFDSGFGSTPKEWYRTLVADLDGALESLAALDALGQEKFGDAAPSYYRIRDALQEVRQLAGQFLARKLETDPDPPAAEPPAPAMEIGGAEAFMAEAGVDLPGDAGVVGGAAGAVGPTAAGATLAPLPQSREDAAARIAAAARFLRAETPADPAPYLLLRGFRWGELRARSGGIDPRLLAAPPTEIRIRLKGLGLDGMWAELLEAAEEVMATPYGRGWLDLQRYVLSALEGLGSEYDPVAAAVRGSIRSLLQDLPELPGLSLMDDSPAANAETMAWLSATGILGAAPDLAEEPLALAAGRVGARRDPYDRALDMVRGGKPQPAIDLLIREAAQERSPRARFLRRAQAAEVMVGAGLEPVALPILNELLEQIEKHQLDEWETGEIVAQPLGLLYRSLGKLEEDPELREALYLRICRLDPLQAIQLGAAAPGNGGEYGDGSDDE